MKISVVTLAALFVVSAVSAQAEDYSPFPEASIRTVSFKDDGSGYVRIAVAVTSKTDRPFNTIFECSLFDAERQPYATASASADAVPPGQTVAADALVEERLPASVSCRLTAIIPR